MNESEKEDKKVSETTATPQPERKVSKSRYEFEKKVFYNRGDALAKHLSDKVAWFFEQKYKDYKDNPAHLIVLAIKAWYESTQAKKLEKFPQPSQDGPQVIPSCPCSIGDVPCPAARWSPYFQYWACLRELGKPITPDSIMKARLWGPEKHEICKAKKQYELLAQGPKAQKGGYYREKYLELKAKIEKETNAEIARLKTDNQYLRTQTEDLKYQLATAKANKEHFQRLYEASPQKNKEEIDLLKSQLEEAHSLIKRKEQIIVDLRDQNSRANQKMGSLIQENKSLKMELDRLQPVGDSEPQIKEEVPVQVPPSNETPQIKEAGKEVAKEVLPSEIPQSQPEPEPLEGRAFPCPLGKQIPCKNCNDYADCPTYLKDVEDRRSPPLPDLS